MSLSAMEAALKPQVLATLDQIAALYKRLGKLQDAQVEAALGAEELSTSQERRFQKLRNETVDLVKSLRLNNNRIEALVDQMYGINRRLVSLEGRLIRLAEARGVERARFSEAVFRQRTRSELGAPRRPADRARLEGFRVTKTATGSRKFATTSRCWRRKHGSRSRISAVSCRRCRRASAKAARRRRR